MVNHHVDALIMLHEPLDVFPHELKLEESPHSGLAISKQLLDHLLDSLYILRRHPPLRLHHRSTEARLHVVLAAHDLIVGLSVSYDNLGHQLHKLSNPHFALITHSTHITHVVVLEYTFSDALQLSLVDMLVVSDLMSV